MIVILAIGIFVLLLVGLIYFFIKDFVTFLKQHIVKSFQPNNEFYDLGELFVSIIVVVTISVFSFLFYKTLSILTAYIFTSDLLGFFTLLRNVFSTTTSDLQNPFGGSNLFSGLILSPAAEFLSIGFMILAIRSFVTRINKTYKMQIYSEGDTIFFEFVGTLVFIFIEIIFYSQLIHSLANQVFHLVYLACSKLSIITFLFAIEHSRYIRNEEYRISFQEYVSLDPMEKVILLKPLNTVLFTFFNAILINVPFFLGQQFLSGFKLYFLFIINILIFFFLFKLLFAKGWNYLAVILFAERSKRTSTFSLSQNFAFRNTTFYVILGFLVLVLIFCVPRLFLFILFILGFATILFLLMHVFIYFIGFCISLAIAKQNRFSLPIIRPKVIFLYLLNTIKSLGRALSIYVFFVILAIFILSIFPKTFEYRNPDNSNAIIDHSGNLLFNEEAGTVKNIAISNSDVDPIFFKFLYCQEDRQFLSQNNWLPQKSNWHGLSLSGFRVLSGHIGSSNLNMQCIKNLAYKSFPQDISRKFSESICSYELSIQKTPSEIANHYINCVGFAGGTGGNEGLFTESLYLFGRPAKQLNSLELLFLVSSLKRGQSFKVSSELIIPYSEVHEHSDLIKKKLISTAKYWQEQGLLTKKEVNSIRRHELSFTNNPFKPDIATTTREYLKKILPYNAQKNARTYISSINLDNQKRIKNAIKKFDNQFRRYKIVDDYNLYSAAIVVNVKTGEIIGHHGGSEGVTDLSTLGSGNPMASLIKPFVLLEMLENNVEIKLYDGKISGKQTPSNFNHIYSNKYVGIIEILSKSLNAPMVNIREVTDPITLFSEVEDHFKLMDIPSDPFLQLENPNKTRENAYNYPLGSRNMTLLNIAQTYQTLFNDGEFVKLSAIQSGFNPANNKTDEYVSIKKQIYTRENTDKIKEALTYSLNGTASSIKSLLPKNQTYYIKTGTSDESLHGYTVICDGELLIVSYTTYGKVINERLELNSTPTIPFKSGIKSAGVLAAFIYSELIN